MKHRDTKARTSVLLVLAGLVPGTALASAPGEAYQAAVQDAAVVEESEVVSTLTPVDPSNQALVWSGDGKRVKVVTWKAAGSYERFIKPYPATWDKEDYIVWVTMAPEMQTFCKELMAANPTADKAALDLRLKQRLGLNPEWQYDVFVELWVSPEDIFRPCMDPSPADTRCETRYPDPLPVVKNVKDYKAFYEGLYFKSFRTPAGVPWTGLGYTYDWGNAAGEQGASEFILSPSAPYEVVAAVPTADYCKP